MVGVSFSRRRKPCKVREACGSGYSPGFMPPSARRRSMDPHDSTEVWKPVPLWDGWYEVSNIGRVRSLRNTRANLRVTPLVLKPTLLTNGYLQVSLCRSGLRKKMSVHRLVLLTHVGPPTTGTQARHLNDIKTDNRFKNLRWGTAKENKADSYRNKRSPIGERCPQAKLNPASVREIRLLNQDGFSHRMLADQFDVSHWAIQRVCARTSWKHVE